MPAYTGEYTVRHHMTNPSASLACGIGVSSASFAASSRCEGEASLIHVGFDTFISRRGDPLALIPHSSLSLGQRHLRTCRLVQQRTRSCEHSRSSYIIIVAHHKSKPLPRSYGAAPRFNLAPYPLISPTLQKSPCKTSQIGIIR